MVRGRLLVPRFSLRQFLHKDHPSHQPVHQFSTSGVGAQRGQQRREGGDAGRQSLSAATILEDEKRGIFRVIDISPAKREERKKFKKFGEDDPVPPPRAASMKPTQR